MSSLRGVPAKGTPGRRLFTIGVGAPILAILLIVLLGLIYANTRAWTAIYMTIASLGFAVGTPCLLLGILRRERYRRFQSMNWAEPGDASATEPGRGRHRL